MFSCSLILKLFNLIPYNDKQKQNLRSFCKLVKNKKPNNHTDISKIFRSSTQYLVEVPLAVIRTSSLLGYDATSFAHLGLGIFTHSSMQILLSFVRLNWGQLWTAFFRSLQRCSIRFKSEVWMGHWSYRVVHKPLLGGLDCVLRVQF